MGLALLACVVSWTARAAAAGDPAVVGAWSNVIDLPLVPVHLHLLPNGHLLYWPQHGGFTSEAYVWDPVADTQTAVFNDHTNLFCSGHAFLGDGRLLVTGGHHDANGAGEPHTNVFDYRTNTWTPSADMAEARWYPSSTTLASGDVLTTSGTAVTGQFDDLAEVWQQQSGTWRPLSSALLELPYYPWTFQVPDGRVFAAGPDPDARFLDVSGLGAWSLGPQSHAGFRGYGSPAMIAPDRILITGGGDPNATTEVVDLSAPVPVWTAAGAMAYPRRQHNATVLPDGRVLVTGGTSGAGFDDPCGAVYAAELWDPATAHWITMAPAAAPRLYHSTAVLMPDGRVLVGGGTYTNGNDYPDCQGVVVPDQPNVEYFSPPYLFHGARPSITSAPSLVRYGQTLHVVTPQGASIAKVTWIRLSSTTHSFNQNQRFAELAFAVAGDGLDVTAPATAALAPPGHYLLFVVNQAGVPSIGATVRITGEPPPSGTLVATPSTALVCDGSGSGPSALSWTATGTAAVEVHRNAPDGPLVATGGASGGIGVVVTPAPGDPDPSGAVFYLQDVAEGVPRTADHTLAIATVTLSTDGCPVPAGTIAAGPNPVTVCDDAGGGHTVLTWSSTATTAVEVHAGAADGPLVASSDGGMHQQSIDDVSGATSYYLQDVSTGQPLDAAGTLATVAVSVSSAGCPASGQLGASRDPVPSCGRRSPGSTVLQWTTAHVTAVELREGAPDGPLYVRTASGPYALPLYWMTAPLRFFLQDASPGATLDAAHSLASIDLEPTRTDCVGAPPVSLDGAQPACTGHDFAGVACVLRTRLPPRACTTAAVARRLRPGVMTALAMIDRAATAPAARAARWRGRVLRRVRAAVRAVDTARSGRPSAPCHVALQEALSDVRALLTP